jgi:glyoxylase-like metal-dependent hydrolase (beta-lactamase superfamily II)
MANAPTDPGDAHHDGHRDTDEHVPAGAHADAPVDGRVEAPEDAPNSTQGDADATASAPPALHYRDASVEVHRVVVGPLDNNVHVVRCRQTGAAVLIDAANEHDRLLELCRRLGVQQVVETHGHWDHIQAVEAVRDAGLDVAVAAADADMLPAYDQIIDDDQVIVVGRLRLRAIATPGHTPGSVCFAVEGTPLLFSGDTLFPGGPGATRFPGGDFPTILTSIDRRIFAAFDDTTMVLPGHGADTTVGAERPHLDEWAARGW